MIPNSSKRNKVTSRLGLNLVTSVSLVCNKFCVASGMSTFSSGKGGMELVLIGLHVVQTQFQVVHW